MGEIVDLLDRPPYGLAQVDRILGLRPGRAKRWIDGYRRSPKSYPPDAGVPLVRMRPAVDALREELSTRYPLASGELPDSIAEPYELPRSTVDEALRYELRRARTSAPEHIAA